jgi:hypothetical protein
MAWQQAYVCVVFIARVLQRGARYAYSVLVDDWLWDLYRRGPLWMGFWNGMDEADICARLSGASHASDWLVTREPGAASGGRVTGTNTAGGALGVSDACLQRIQRDFAAFAVLMQFGLYVVCVCMFVASVYRRCAPSGPRAHFIAAADSKFLEFTKYPQMAFTQSHCVCGRCIGSNNAAPLSKSHAHSTTTCSAGGGQGNW